MNVKKTLLNLIKYLHLSDKENKGIKFSENPLSINKNISGQLLKYYQHIYLSNDCYFNNPFLGIVLFSVNSENTEPERWALEDDERFQNNDYVIFAATMIDDVIFCDVREERCPVYTLISGDDKPIKLSDSLFEFLSFYINLTIIQLVDFNKEIYANKNLDYKKEFLEKVYSLINEEFSGEAKNGLIEFTLSGTLHIIGVDK